jgi:spore germination protein KB
MSLEEGRISRLQLFLLVSGFIMGAELITSITSINVGKYNFLVMIGAIVEGVIIAYIFISLIEKFPGKTLVGINDVIYGKYLGRIISSLYIIHFILSISLHVRYFGDFFLSLLFPEMPLVFIMSLLLIIANYSIKNGIEVMTRCSFILIIMFVSEVVITTVLLIPQMDFSNFLPLFDIELKSFLKAIHAMAAIVFGDLIVFFMIIPYVNETKNIKKTTIAGILFGGFILLIILFRNISILGVTARIYSYPSFQSVRLINIREVISRIEILVVAGVIFLMFLRVAVIYYSSIIGMAKLLNLRSYLPLITPIGIIALNIGLLLIENTIEQFEFGLETYHIYAVPFEIGIPLLSLIIAKFKRKEYLN